MTRREPVFERQTGAALRERRWKQLLGHMRGGVAHHGFMGQAQSLERALPDFLKQGARFQPLDWHCPRKHPVHVSPSGQSPLPEGLYPMNVSGEKPRNGVLG